MERAGVSAKDVGGDGPRRLPGPRVDPGRWGVDGGAGRGGGTGHGFEKVGNARTARRAFDGMVTPTFQVRLSGRCGRALLYHRCRDDFQPVRPESRVRGFEGSRGEGGTREEVRAKKRDAAPLRALATLGQKGPGWRKAESRP